MLSRNLSSCILSLSLSLPALAQNKVIFAFGFLLLAFSLKLQSTQPIPNKLLNVHKLLKKETRKTIAEQTTNTDVSTTPAPQLPSAGLAIHLGSSKPR
ncbi:hypothetical protein ACJRO7_034517 [Eucalyptus globulus]|uniref:Uncharacterized protein n=1 Tax=Eucalyptus globulus TaxID=34317 RepID=A0ABD3J6F8_EUCGL